MPPSRWRIAAGSDGACRLGTDPGVHRHLIAHNSLPLLRSVTVILRICGRQLLSWCRVPQAFFLPRSVLGQIAALPCTLDVLAAMRDGR